ncbi:MAG: hypothetical protein BJ554DRAFT_8437 [Olpidium bornovanus]|uniref:Reverse transcriptase Ty1/copia-type domain-containing protein n=1 Tax=Olpidium bornovanus TaxID=278681 RepID=A0A8H7ZUM1_9FUNG|nr:MAG: hypothetical protein BJ554DRAFT_8437 [Olpidium bornovanus]
MDDILLTGPDAKVIKKFEELLAQIFQMSKGGDLSFILGVRITTSNGRRVLDQEHFVKAYLEKFDMQNAKPVATPLKAGALEALTMTMAGDKEKDREGGTERYQEDIGSLM